LRFALPAGVAKGALRIANIPVGAELRSFTLNARLDARPRAPCRRKGRASVRSRRPLLYRFFGVHDGKMILLHAFIKKTQKTPASDLDLAIKRRKEIT
jgi:hypothetical protein